MMTLECQTDKHGETSILRPMCISANQATLSDGGTYFATVTRADLVKLLKDMDEEKARDEVEEAEECIYRGYAAPPENNSRISPTYA